MSLIERLNEIQELIDEAFETENHCLDVFAQLSQETRYLKEVSRDLISQTPLCAFETMIEEAMAQYKFEYQLDLVAISSTCDGDCFEIYYHLTWYDNGLKTQIFSFETLY